ncbi:MAG TPA: class I SAM-dependent methyltransferase, partial [Streptosporangiaceae bacterium]|nr:class I SAM-dependent methyltransferase [Streptosporangiaceae bacterium]
MTSTLTTQPAKDVLSRLFAAAETQEAQEEPAAPTHELTAQERADHLQDVYMPVSRDGGQLLYALTRAARPQTVVEFGTSFGISTIFLAAAVIDNGAGRVVSTELSRAKVDRARANLTAAGVDGAVTVLTGDAQQTLADVPGPIGLVLLDGWKDRYLPVLRLLEPRLAPGALVVADDSTFPSVAGYLAYVRDPAHGYVTVSFPVEDG